MELFFEYLNAVLDNVERKQMKYDPHNEFNKFCDTRAKNADKFETMSYETAKAQGLIPDSTEQKARASDLQRENERLRTVNHNLRGALDETLDFLSGMEDVVDGDYGIPAPNSAMRLAILIREELVKAEV